jgi:hypothetical protein
VVLAVTVAGTALLLGAAEELGMTGRTARRDGCYNRLVVVCIAVDEARGDRWRSRERSRDNHGSISSSSHTTPSNDRCIDCT